MKKITLSEDTIASINGILKKHTSYDDFVKDKIDAYTVSSLIGAKICPYCNINYTYTVISDKLKCIVRPDFDHFISKKIKQAHALKRTNLVPSCQQCNSRLKHGKEFSPSTHIHPYVDDFDEIAEFRISTSTTNYLDENSIKIEIVDRKRNAADWGKAKANINAFALAERYQFHKDEVVNLFKLVAIYNDFRLSEIADITKSRLDMQSILSDYKNIDINKVSLGKLKKDALRQLLQYVLGNDISA